MNSESTPIEHRALFEYSWKHLSRIVNACIWRKMRVFLVYSPYLYKLTKLSSFYDETEIL